MAVQGVCKTLRALRSLDAANCPPVDGSRDVALGALAVDHATRMIPMTCRTPRGANPAGVTTMSDVTIPANNPDRVAWPANFGAPRLLTVRMHDPPSATVRATTAATAATAFRRDDGSEQAHSRGAEAASTTTKKVAAQPRFGRLPASGPIPSPCDRRDA